jgi:UDP-N-acetylglucosamine pyrophosphorylase
VFNEKEVFIGAFYSKKLDVLNKTVKANKGESVGAFLQNENKIKIKEYSESASKGDQLKYLQSSFHS